MTSADLQTLQGAYEAFNRGDIPAVLAVMDANIEWNEPG
jgi:ketosteroid isomerase-like protein